MLLTLIASASSTKSIKGAAAALLLLAVVFAIVLLISVWKVFKKANRPGWAAIIPFYNNYVLFEISGLSGWLGVIGSLLVYFADDLKSIPLIITVFVVYMILYIMAAINLSKKFKKGLLFAIFGLTILPFVGYPYLAFSDAKYISSGPKDKTS